MALAHNIIIAAIALAAGFGVGWFVSRPAMWPIFIRRYKRRHKRPPGPA